MSGTNYAGPSYCMTRGSFAHPVRVTVSFTHSCAFDVKPQPLQSQHGVDREDLGKFESMLIQRVKGQHPYNLACMLLSRPKYMTLYSAECLPQDDDPIAAEYVIHYDTKNACKTLTKKSMTTVQTDRQEVTQLV